MTFKEWSSLQTAAANDKPGDKLKGAPGVKLPPGQPEKKAAEVSPAPKP